MKRQIKSVIFGCHSLELSPEEKIFFKKYNPLGLILFDRNIKNPEQVKKLISSFRSCVGRKNAPVLIDQEGGRVQRLWPPYWTGLPFCRTYGEWFVDNKAKAVKSVKKHAKILAKDLLSVGVNIDCWPCLDVATPETHDIMAKRCFSDNPITVAELGQIAVDTALSCGLMPIIKHIPGYGRATVDPHQKLPIVTTDLSRLKQTDFYPFIQMDMPVWGMTAHVIYTALDKKLPATLSKKTLNYIRKTIGFNGFLICDDMSMHALDAFGSPPELAKKIIKAGCDAVLHCNGNLSDMQSVIDKIPYLSNEALNRLKKAENLL